MIARPWGVYVHVPWCRIRCPYCAFHVDPDRGIPADAFVGAVARAWQARRSRFPGRPHTVYVGGGTPSRLPSPALSRLLRTVQAHEAVEVTVEANPEDVDEAWVHAAREAGVDRVSLGIQTLQPDLGQRLGRRRTARSAPRAAALVAQGFRTWSADLMFGLPGQTLDLLERDLDALLALDPPHVSLYGLTIEPETAFARGVATGRLRPSDDDLWRAMYDRLVLRLEEAGLLRYEVSNFARAGHASEHNRGYWLDRPYLGLGPSAHGYAPDGARWVERADTDAWIAADDPTSLAEEEPWDPEHAAVERLVSGLRGVEGIDLGELASRTGLAPSDAVLSRLSRGGVLAREGERTRLTPSGFPVADAVVRALVDALAPVAQPPSGG